jgi:hypothetical protein
VTSPTRPGDENFVTASSQLNDGLKSCRAVLSNYRSWLAGDGAGEGSQAGFNETGDEEDDDRSST